MRIFARFWFQKEDKSYLGVGRIDLLTRIDRTGSISKAAKEMGMSYKAAWDSVDIVNKLSPTPLVDSSNGGKGGGGSKLTPAGKEAIYAFNETERVKNIFFDYLDQSSDFKELLERLSHLESALQNFKPKN